MASFYPIPDRKYIITLLISSLFAFIGLTSFAQTAEYLNVAGNGTWQVPCGVTSITVETWGGGGAGGGVTISGSKQAGGGGAGGAFARKLNLAVTPLSTINYHVGAGGVGNLGAGNVGGDTWFMSNTTVLAKGGAGGAANNGPGGVGSTAGCIGDVVYRGGHGWQGTINVGGAGGAGAGNGANGGDATATAGGIGVYGGGNGAAARIRNIDGNGPGFDCANNEFGGGGGGAIKGKGGATHNGGNGHRGYIKITYNAPATYCNIVFNLAVEPITLVNFGGINHSSSAAVNGTPALERFCDEATVLKNSPYTITVKGNTDGWYTNYFTVFFDWNQDGDYDDSGERYEIGTISNSTGVDAKTASLSITIPNGAPIGKTKMRVVKNFGSAITSACGNYGYGQAEEYYVNVTSSCVAPTQALINGQAGTVTVCAGTQVNLTQVGGSSGAGNWIWRKNSCTGAQENTNNNPDALYSIVPTGVGVTTFYVNASCGTTCASVTLVVTGPGGITHTSGAQNLDLCNNSNIVTPVVYTATGYPVTIGLTGSLPPGVTGNFSGNTYTISGTPNVGVTGTYNYTLSVTGNSPCANTPATISGSITVFAVPTLIYSSNSATYCMGAPITANTPTITGGATANSFSVSPALPAGLSLNTATGEITGTPSALQAATNYTITANTNCGTASKVISIAIVTGNTPYALTPTGTGNYCSNFTGVVIGLVNSDNGVNYQLLLNGTPIGAPINSTGGPINFGAQTLPGTYTVQTSSGCATNMLGSYTINVSPAPTTQFSYPSNTFCKAGISDAAVITGAPQTGTFSASPATLVFANNATGEIDLNLTPIGNYVITYTVPASGGCMVYTYTQNISILNSPGFYNVTGGGAYCSGGVGVPVGLNGSQSGITYTLYRNGVSTGISLTGNGSTLNFGNQTQAGVYTVTATLASCSQEMDYSATVTVNAAPSNIVITPNSNSVCLGNVVAFTASGVPPTNANGNVTASSGNINLSIPDNNKNGTFHILRVTGIPVGATITGVSINFNIHHTYDGDLRINLKGPNGNVLNIANRIGGGGNNFINTTVNNLTGTNTNISAGTAAFTGTYLAHAQPNIAGATAINNNNSGTNTLFSDLYGATAASANGDWILSVRDVAGGDNGTFNNWSITIHYTTIGNTINTVWTPAPTDLYTDPAATIAYSSGASASTIYVKPTIAGVKTYTATVTNAGGCSATATANLTVNASPIITVTADYCSKSAQNLVVITASSNVNINTWTWSGGQTAINTATTSTIEVNTAGTYYVSALASGYPCVGTGQMSIAQELVVNGDFELGNVGFTTDYNFSAPTDFNTNLRIEGYYTVNSQPNYNHDNFWGVDHTFADGNGKYMLVNGAPGSGMVVWRETVNVLPNTNYYFAAYAVSLNSASPFADLIFRVNGVIVGSGTGGLPPKLNNNSPGTWKRAYGIWSSGAVSGPIDIEIINLQTATGGNDFGLDDISFATLSSFFNLTSAPGTDEQLNVCQGQPIVDIEYEVGGDGAAPTLTSGALPNGLQTFWNGRNFRIYGTPTSVGTFNYTYGVGLGGTCGAPKTKTGKIIVIDSSKAGTFASPIISVCSGTSGNLATNLTGTVGSLTWISSPTGNPGSFSSTTGTYTNLTSAAYYKAIALNTSACVNDTSDMVLLGVKNLWVGGNSNWHDNLNWSDHLQPTMACDDVIIPQVSPKFSPILDNSMPSPQIKNLKMLAGGRLEITDDAYLKIAGTITSDAGAITAHEGNIELNAASGSQSISGSNFKNRNLKRLLASSDVNVSNVANDTLNILFDLSFGNTNADLNTGNNVTLRSTEANTASVGKLAVGNTVSGQFNVERFIKYYQNWNMLSAPISNAQSLYSSWQENGAPKTSNGYGTQITGPIAGTGMDTISIGNSVKYYDAAAGNYTMINRTDNNSVNRKEGYFIYVRGDRGYGPGASGSKTTLRSKGTIYDASNVPSISYPGVPANSFVQLGNPYASPVNLKKLAQANSSIESNFYFWDPTLSGYYGVGGYQTVAAATDGVITPGSGLYLVSKKYPNMQSGQAIFARTLTAGATIAFAESMKEDSSLTFSRGNHQEADDISMLSTMIYSASGNLEDGNRVVFHTDYSNALDKWDAIKLTNGGINFGLLRHQKKLAVEARQPVTTTDTLFYNMSNLRTGSYTLGISVQNIPAGNEAFLIDAYLQRRTAVSLLDSSWYAFTTDGNAASKASNRFMLVFKAAAGPLPVTITSISAARNSDRSIAVRWTVENEVNIEKYTVERSADGLNFTGILTADPTNSNAYTKNDLSPLAADNFYRINALTLGGGTQYSAIVKVAPLQEMASISVYPNPVINGMAQIKFTNKLPGNYEVKLYNQAAQLMQQQAVKVLNSNFIYTLSLPTNLAGGVYQLSIFDENGASTTQQIIVK